MKTVVLLVISLVLSGCGGDFTTTAFSAQGPDGETGGAFQATGGSSHSTGGSSQGTGGSSQAGGSPATGGAPEIDSGPTGSGGAPVETGGSPSTGGVVVATGGVPAVDAGCVLVTHENGAGQTWQDCTPFGMHNEEQALKACQAWSTAVGGSKCVVGSTGRCGDTLSKVSALDDAVSFLMEWRWQGTNTGKLTSGAGSVCDTLGTWN